MNTDDAPGISEQEEELVQRVADAMYKQQVDQARAKVAAYVIDYDRIRRVFKVAHEESDRAAAILLFALAEDLMLEGLRRNLNPKVSGGWKAVTDGNGVLATASDRITMLHLLRWIRDGTCADIGLLKSIRNRFAHHADVDSFDDQKIRGWVSTLSPREKSLERVFGAEKVAAWPKFTAKRLYFLRATGTIISLVNDLALGPISRMERVNPSDVGGDWETGLDNLKEISRIAAEAVLWCVPSEAEQ
jgi:hypothetical protein